jgi:hypothetical protein
MTGPFTIAFQLSFNAAGVGHGINTASAATGGQPELQGRE